MSDQGQVPPQLAALMGGGPPAGAAPADGQAQSGPPGAPLVSPVLTNDQVMDALRQAVQLAAQKSRGADDARDSKDYLQAALFGSQALVILDPTRIALGDTAAVRAAATPPKVPPTRDGNHNGVIGA